MDGLRRVQLEQSSAGHGSANGADAGRRVPAAGVMAHRHRLGQLADHLEAADIGAGQFGAVGVDGLGQADQRRQQRHARVAAQRRGDVVVVEHVAGDTVAQRGQFQRQHFPRAPVAGGPARCRQAAAARVLQRQSRSFLVPASNGCRIGVQQGTAAGLHQLWGQVSGLEAACKGGDVLGGLHCSAPRARRMSISASVKFSFSFNTSLVCCPSSGAGRCGKPRVRDSLKGSPL